LHVFIIPNAKLKLYFFNYVIPGLFEFRDANVEDGVGAEFRFGVVEPDGNP
jgi:hypothetical protein